MDKFTYEADGKDLSVAEKCMKCGQNITDDEYAYEDYYVVFRGHGPKTFQGVLCFDCMDEIKPKK